MSTSTVDENGAVINGARGLVFFGGHMTQIASPADAAAGWNWRDGGFRDWFGPHDVHIYRFKR